MTIQQALDYLFPGLLDLLAGCAAHDNPTAKAGPLLTLEIWCDSGREDTNFRLE
jgi:hypothetical protein